MEAYQFAPLAVGAALFLVWHRIRLSSDVEGVVHENVMFAPGAAHAVGARC
jgi:hypothetical protein